MVYQNAVAAPRQELTEVVMEGRTTSEMFVGLKVLAPRPMKLPTGHFPKITIAQGDLMRATSATRTPGSRFDRWQSAISDGLITLVQVPEELQIPDEQSFIYDDYFAFEQVYAKEATNRLQRFHELNVSTTIQTSGQFDQVNSAIAYTAVNLQTMTPTEDILAAIRRIKGRGELPNTIVIPGQVYDRVRVSTDMRTFVAGANQPGALVSPNTIQRAFEEHGIKQVLVADGYVNQSEQLQNTVINAIWNLATIFVGDCQPGELLAGGVGRTFYWEREGPLFNIQTYRDEPVKSNVIRAITTHETLLTNTRAGTLIGTQYA